jgi:hypothetical protein
MSAPSASKLLSTYLNDHLAGSVVALELAKRASSENRGTEFGAFLESLTTEIESDRATLKTIMDRVDVGEDRLKQAAALLAERAGRLKLNGQLRGYSPLSRLVELEALSLGVDGKLALWRSLEEVSSADSRLSEFDFEQLGRRALAQRDGIEEHRLRAARLALLP